MANHGRDKLIEMAFNTVVNALWDKYNAAGTPLSWEDYWKKHLKITGVQSVDSYIQGKVSAAIGNGLDTASEVASAVKRALGL